MSIYPRFAVLASAVVACGCASTGRGGDMPVVSAHKSLGTDYYKVDGRKFESLELAVDEVPAAADAAAASSRWRWTGIASLVVGGLAVTLGIGNEREGLRATYSEPLHSEAYTNAQRDQDAGHVLALAGGLVTVLGLVCLAQADAARLDAINIFNDSRWGEIRRDERSKEAPASTPASPEITDSAGTAGIIQQASPGLTSRPPPDRQSGSVTR